MRGYDRRAVDRLLAEIADSFEAVWHERTRLYEDVLRLQEQLRGEQPAIMKLRDDAERTRSELKDAQANVRELRAAIDQREPTPGNRGQDERLTSAEPTRLNDAAEELRKERDQLREEVRRLAAVAAEERKKLVEFLLDAQKQIERVPSNGLEAADPSQLNESQNGPRNADHRSLDSAREDTDAASRPN